MNAQRDILATILRQSGRTLAGYAAREWLDADAAATAVPAADPQAFWQELFAAQLTALAAALEADRPQTFVNQVRWARVYLQSRDVEPARLRAGLASLCAVLRAELPEELRDTAQRNLDNALAQIGDPPSEMAGRLTAEGPSERLSSQYLLALLEGSPQRAARLIFEALAAGHTVPDLILNVLLPALAEVGRMWMADEINIAEEHLASMITRRTMAQLMSRALIRPYNGKTLVAAAVAGNQHEVGVEVLSYFFEMDGWRVIPLGANVPIDDLVQAVEFYRADLVGLSISLPDQLPTLRSAIQAVRGSTAGPKIMVGGGGLAGLGALAKQFAADAYAADPLEALKLGRALVGLAADAPATP